MRATHPLRNSNALRLFAAGLQAGLFVVVRVDSVFLLLFVVAFTAIVHLSKNSPRS
jgi:hypothetical protein